MRCGSLTSVPLPNSLTTLANEAFAFCSSLSTITLPSSLTNFGINVFNRCSNLAAISVGNLNPAYTSVAGVLFDVTQTKLVQFPPGKVGDYAVPSGVTSIGPCAFFSCSLSKITISSSITLIDYAAFAYSSLLGELYFRGDAPVLRSQTLADTFVASPNATVYYLPTAAGWDSTFANRPAAFWLPILQTGDSDFGVRGNQFGFTMNWASGMTVVVEAATNLTIANWVPLQTNILSSDSLYFSDPQWTNHPARFYRIRSP